MISSRELKDQIEQLNEQNQSLTDEIKGIKEMLNNQANNGAQSSDNNPDSNRDQNQNQSQNQSNADKGVSNIANDLAKLKDMTNQLENKMKTYISNNSSGEALNEEDVINLILTLMNGMIDWTTDFVSKQSNQSTT